MQPTMDPETEPKVRDWSEYDSAVLAEAYMLVGLLTKIISEERPPPKAFGLRKPKYTFYDRASCYFLKVELRLSYRDVEAMLKALSGLCSDFGISMVPDHNTIWRTADLMDEDYMKRINLRVVEAKARNVGFDATGLSNNEFLRWLDEKGDEKRKGQWEKLHTCSDTDELFILNWIVTDSNVPDITQLGALATPVAETYGILRGVGDKGYCSRENNQIIADLGGDPYIDFKDNCCIARAKRCPEWKRKFYMWKERPEEFYANYHQRSKVETPYSIVKGHYSGKLFSRTPHRRRVEIGAKVVLYNIKRTAHVAS